MEIAKRRFGYYPVTMKMTKVPFECKPYFEQYLRSKLYTHGCEQRQTRKEVCLKLERGAPHYRMAIVQTSKKGVKL